MMTPRSRRAIRRSLLAWYDENARDLPWRRTRDPYGVWVSEIMAQQTRVETVVDYWNRFMARYPTVADLAAAPLDDVLSMWAGLGYYARARNMHRAARLIVDEHGGVFPADAETLATLPGLGRYTVGAVASIAFSLPLPVVDGNVGRVLARLDRIGGDPGATAAKKRFWEMAEALVDPERPGDFNQALMELGARVCTPRSPDCGACPIARTCAAHRAGDVDRFPGKKVPPKRKSGRVACAAVVRRGRVLLAQRPAQGLLGGLWELPAVDLRRGENHQDALARGLPQRVGLELQSATDLAEVFHQFSHLDLTYTAYRCRARGRARAGEGYDRIAWVAPEDLAQYGTGRAIQKLLGHLWR